jgi:hypothetical protein
VARLGRDAQRFEPRARGMVRTERRRVDGEAFCGRARCRRQHREDLRQRALGMQA